MKFYKQSIFLSDLKTSISLQCILENTPNILFSSVLFATNDGKVKPSCLHSKPLASILKHEKIYLFIFNQNMYMNTKYLFLFITKNFIQNL